MRPRVLIRSTVVAIAPPDAVVQARVPRELDRRADLLRAVEDEPDQRPQAGARTGRPEAV